MRAASLVVGVAAGLAARASAAPVCTPVAGGASLTEMSRPEGLGLHDVGLAQAVWTGTEALMWVSWPRPERDAFVAYSPRTNTWRQVPSRGVPHLRRPAFVWVAGRAVLWGGVRESSVTGEGVIFDPATGAAQPTSTVNAPLGRQFHSAAVVGGRMVVFGGGGGGGVNGWSCDGALFDPVRNSWRRVTGPPPSVCAWIAGARIVAASSDRFAVMFSEPSQRPRFQVALYDVAAAAWTAGPIFAPERRLSFSDAGAFGPDGGLYVVASGDFQSQEATVFRVDAGGRFEAFAPACEQGPVVRVGERLGVVGTGAACLIDPARKQCLWPARGIGLPNVRARQLSVFTDEGFLTWGYGAGTVMRWGSPGENVAPPISGNVRGLAVAGARPHCGGAALPPWLPRIGETVAASSSLLIRRGTSNTVPAIAAEIRTDGDGLFQAKLPPGPYCVVGLGQREVKLKLAKGTDKGTASCLTAENAKCLTTFEVPASAAAPVPVIVRIPNNCFGPCYHGPLPP